MKNLVVALTLRLVDRLSSPSRSAASAVGGIERAQRMASKASEKWTKGLDELDGRLTRLASASLVTEGLGRAGDAMMRPLKAASDQATAYEVKLAEIGDTADMTADRIGRMDRSIRAASRLGRGPTQIADAAGIYIAGGMDEGTAAGLLDVTTKLVVGQRLAFDDAANAAMAFNQSLGVSAEEMERAFDAAATAGKAGRFELKAMSQYLPTVGALGANRGLRGVAGVSELTAALTTIMDKTQDEGLSATRLRDLFMKMDAPTTVKAFEKYGVDVASGMARAKAEGRSPLDAIMDMTEEAMRKGARLNQLFSEQDSQLGIQFLMEGRERFTALRDEAAAASGVVEASYRRLRGTNSERQMSYTAGVERMSIAVGMILAPALAVAVPLLEKVADWMSKSAESGSFVAKAAVWAVAGLAGFAVAAGAVGQAVVGILGPFFIMKTLFGTMGGAAFQAAGAKVIGTLARMRMGMIAFNLSMLANPVGLVIAAVVAAVAVVALVVRKYWQPIKAFFGGFAQGLGQAFAPLGAALAPMKPIWDGFVGMLGKAWNWITKLLEPVKSTEGELASAASAGQKFGQFVGGAFKLVLWPFRALFAIGQAVWPILKRMFAFSPLGLVITHWRPISTFVGGVIERVRAIVSGGWAVLKTVLSFSPLQVLRAGWDTIGTFFGGLVTRFHNYGREIAQGLINGLKSMPGAVGRSIVNTATGAVDGFKRRLGIRSPSRVFAALGEHTVAGLVGGLGRSAPRAVAAMAAIGAGMTTALPAVAAPAINPAAALAPAQTGGGRTASGAGGLTQNITQNFYLPAGAPTDIRALARELKRIGDAGQRRAMNDAELS